MAQAKATAARVGEKKTLRQLVSRDRHLMLMFLPVFIFYIVFCYLPMAGLAMAFQDFKMGSGFVGVFTSEWVGLKWFQQFFNSVFAWRLIRNTFLLSFYSLIFGFPIPIIFAICITQLRNQRVAKVAQVITYLPYFISTVVVVGMMTNFLSPSSGIINQIIKAFGGKPVNFMSNPAWFRRLYVISGSWQSFGFNAIIFVAAIMGIDPSLYGALAVFCAIIGEVTPPMGPQLWIAAPICKEKIGNIMREAWAFLGVQVLALILVTLFPQISLFLVHFVR